MNGLNRLQALFTADELLVTPEQCWAYGYDNSMQHGLPEAVILPKTSEQIRAAIQICAEENIPFTVRGRGTGTTGAAVPIQGGVVCVMEHFHRILEINIADRYLIAEAGVTNQEVQEACRPLGFFWPPDPTSSAYCSIGGNLACNAGGPRAIKYGTARDNVLGLRAITGSGQLIKTGSYATKNSVAYDLTRLMIGSEGTLAVITEATLKLTPLPASKTTFQAYYRDIHSATLAITTMMAQAVRPCVLEFVDRHCLDLIRRHATDMPLPEHAQAMLLIEVDEVNHDIEQAARNEGLLEITVAKTERDIAALWKTRKALSPAMRKIAPKKINEDVVVPVSAIPTLLKNLDSYAEQFAIPIVNFGHAGNGNIHVNLLIDPDDPVQAHAAEQCLDKIFDLVISLRGSLSGEHGIGLAKRSFIPREIDPATLELMKAIKRQFDPAGILNPGKIF